MDEWHVRIRGRTMGPFRLQQLLEMKDRGQLQPFHEISDDHSAWQVAGNVDGLFPRAATTRLGHDSPSIPQPLPAAPVGMPTAQKNRDSRPVTMIVAGVLALIVAMTIFVGVLVVITTNRGQSTVPAVASATNRNSDSLSDAATTAAVAGRPSI